MRVSIAYVGEDVIVFAPFCHDLHFVAELTTGAGYQYVHDCLFFVADESSRMCEPLMLSRVQTVG